jgi:acyl carrier protein
MKLEAVMQKVLPFAVGGEHTQESLLDLGMDSLSAISLVNSIKQEFEVDVPLEALYKTDMNVETLATVLEHQQGKDKSLVDDSTWGTYMTHNIGKP